MKRQWTAEEANAWYAERGWLRGCNFIGSDCANRVDMWQSYGAEARLGNADRELALCEKIGFNTIRIILEFDVWLQERESFLAILERYVSMAASHGQSVMIVLANEAQLPRGDVNAPYVPKKLGEQAYALGYHQGRLPLPPEEAKLPAHHVAEKPGMMAEYLRMIHDVVGKYAKDERVICWNVYNEPGIGIGKRSIPLLRAFFEACRAEDPIQPLCADVWRTPKGAVPLTEEEQVGLALSDVVSLHSYKPYDKMVPILEAMKGLGRPVLITEWLNRINHSEVRELYPLFYLEHIGCYCWGFVLGKTQTQEPWETLWAEYYDPQKHVDYDFTRWQHDLFRPNLRPYDPHEVELIETYDRLAAARDGK